MFTFPSAVTAAKTVDEYGAQATSPTALPRSNVNIGSLANNNNYNYSYSYYYYYYYYYYYCYYSTPDPVSSWTGDCLQAGKRYLT